MWNKYDIDIMACCICQLIDYYFLGLPCFVLYYGSYFSLSPYQYQAKNIFGLLFDCSAYTDCGNKFMLYYVSF